MATHRLVLLRHGQSVWNLENRFTGWVDVGLTDKGVEEAQEAGRLLRDEGFLFDCVHTSLLKRAIRTMHFALEELDQLWIPVHKSWRLNERHYGALQGLDKREMAEKHGDEQVHLWRRSYDVRPPPLDRDDPMHPRFHRRYASMAPDQVPDTECLKDVVARFLPYWNEAIVPEVQKGKQVLVVAHGNSLRALVKHLDGIADDEIPGLNIPTGIPLVYELDDDMKPVKSQYLGDPDKAKAAAEAVALQAQPEPS